MTDASPLDAGDQAPDFKGPTQDGSMLRLSDYQGQRVALYFYPEDDTPGCTKQACSLRDGYEQLQGHGVAVIGVSKDDVASHERFAQKYDLPFPLVADPEHHILKRYGVWGERQMYGNTFMGTKRTTFVIDEDGTIQKVIRRPSTETHADEVMKAFKQD